MKAHPDPAQESRQQKSSGAPERGGSHLTKPWRNPGGASLDCRTQTAYPEHEPR